MVDPYTLKISVMVGTLHGLIETFLVYIESRAAKTSKKNYIIVCMNGRFDWLPYENILRETILNEDGEHDQSMALDYGNISHTICK